METGISEYPFFLSAYWFFPSHNNAVRKTRKWVSFLGEGKKASQEFVRSLISYNLPNLVPDVFTKCLKRSWAYFFQEYGVSFVFCVRIYVCMHMYGYMCSFYSIERSAGRQTPCHLFPLLMIYISGIPMA